ncbi:unnamed protein product, partial [Tetraodon nigroviridis]
PLTNPRTMRTRPAGRTPSTTRGPRSCSGARPAARVRPPHHPADALKSPGLSASSAPLPHPSDNELFRTERAGPCIGGRPGCPRGG